MTDTSIITYLLLPKRLLDQLVHLPVVDRAGHCGQWPGRGTVLSSDNLGLVHLSPQNVGAVASKGIEGVTCVGGEWQKLGNKSD